MGAFTAYQLAGRLARASAVPLRELCRGGTAGAAATGAAAPAYAGHAHGDALTAVLNHDLAYAAFSATRTTRESD